MRAHGEDVVIPSCIILLLVGVAGCPRSQPTPRSRDSASSQPDLEADAATKDSRVETAGDVAATRREAEQLARSLLSGGIAAREVTSIADIRGVRLMRKRRLRQALVWFDVGVKTDPTFEPCLFNGAVAAARAGDRKLAARYLDRLRALQTPLSKRKMQDARKTHELSTLAR